MSRKSQARRLALSVAVALSAGGGALFPVMPHAFAADVSGQNVTVDNPADPQLTAPGISAGEINGWTDAGNVTNNTLTLSGVTYSFGNVYGGFTVGTGNAAANKAFMTDGTASYLYGGFVFGANSTGNATGNELTLSGGTVNRDVAGGVIQGPSATSQGKGDVSGNVVNVSGGTVNGTTYGGTTQGIGSVKNNTATVSGTATVLHDVLGGRSMTGEVSGNILNFQGATADNLIGGRIAGTNAAGNAATNTVTVTSGTINNDVRGGEIIAPSATGNVSGNIVNVNGATTTIGGAVTAGYNMGKGKADRNELHITDGTIAGVVTGGHSTQMGEVSGNTVDIAGGTLSDNIRGGFAYDGKASANTVTITGGTLSGSTIVGGFSANGAASGNTATVGTVAFTGNIMGGSAATGADTNKVILKDSAAISGNAYGGLVGNGGDVADNKLTITGGSTTKNAYGGHTDGTGTANADKNDSMKNKVNLNGGYTTSAGGKATGNTVNVTANFTGNVTGGVSTTGAASRNIVNLGAVTVGGNVTGGQGVTTGLLHEGKFVFVQQPSFHGSASFS